MKDLLLVIDMQNVYLSDQPWACEGIDSVCNHIAELLDSRKCDPVFTLFVPPEAPVGVWKDYNREYADINSNPWMSEPIETFKKYHNTYPVYTKQVYSCYNDAKLKEALCKFDRVVITGVVAECCVLSTVCGAIDAGQKVLYLTDAVAGLSKEVAKQTADVLSNFSPMHLLTMTTKEYLELGLDN
ncbi:MAG: isochorismatase family protein [bacterium]|nr:isochorismatase family protein [bacterium]